MIEPESGDAGHHERRSVQPARQALHARGDVAVRTRAHVVRLGLIRPEPGPRVPGGWSCTSL